MSGSALAETARSLLEKAAEKAQALWAAEKVTFVAVGALVAVAFVLEVLARRDWRRYLSRNFGTDAAYSLFYVGGVYSFLFSGPLFKALSSLIEAHAPFLQVRLLEGLAPALQVAILLPVTDLIAYWTHRWLHASPALWAVHRLHHSQTRLTPLTAYRVHFLEIFLLNFGRFLVALLLGVPSAVWLPVSLITLWIPLLAHSDLGFGFGPLDRVLVSPRFHSVHHSVAPEHYDRNFAQVFSFWDDLFATSVRVRPRPREYGVPGVRIPESFLRQLVHPFLAWARGRP